MLEKLLENVGLVAAIALPFFNIPLIIRIVKRKSSADISLSWVIGVWVCAMLMFPSGIKLESPVWRTYNIINIVLFTGVFFTVLKYRKGKC